MFCSKKCFHGWRCRSSMGAEGYRVGVAKLTWMFFFALGSKPIEGSLRMALALADSPNPVSPPRRSLSQGLRRTPSGPFRLRWLRSISYIPLMLFGFPGAVCPCFPPSRHKYAKPGRFGDEPFLRFNTGFTVSFDIFFHLHMFDIFFLAPKGNMYPASP